MFYLDEGYRLYPSLRLLQGESLFRDIFTAYTPVSYYLHLGAYELFGVRISSVRLVLVISQLITTLSIYALSRHLISRGFSLFVALLTVLYGIARLNLGYSGWYVVPLTLLTMLFLFRHMESECSRRFDLVFAGVFAGLCVSTKLRDGVFVVIASLVAILTARILQDFRWGRGHAAVFHPLYAAHLLLPVVIGATLWPDIDWSRAFFLLAPSVALSAVLVARQTFACAEVRPRVGRLCGELALFASGIAATTFPWVFYYAWTVGWGTLGHHLIRIPLAMGEKMPRAWPPSELDQTAAQLLVVVGSVLGGAVVLGRWDRIVSKVVACALLLLPLLVVLRSELEIVGGFFLLPCASGLILVLVCMKWKTVAPPVLKLAVLGVFCCVVPMLLYPMGDFNHWLWVVGPAFIAVGVAASHVYRYLAAHGGRLRWVLVAVQCALVAALIPSQLDPRTFTAQEELRGSPRADTLFDPRSVRQLQPVVDFINENVASDDFILEIPTSFYAFLTGRRQAAQLDYFFVIDSSVWDEDREVALIRERSPRYVFITELAFIRGGWNWLHGFPKVSRFVAENYVLHTRLGAVKVLIKRDARTD